MSVFIVDDDIFYTSILERHLENFKVSSIKMFTDMNEALMGLKEWEPNLLFLDIYLDHIITIDYLKKIKAEHPKIYIVVMTASEDEELRKICYNNGAYYFLEKNKNLERNISKILTNVDKYSEHFQ